MYVTVKDLFRTKSVDEVREILDKSKKEIATRENELKDLVYSKYKSLCSNIEKMKKTSKLCEDLTRKLSEIDNVREDLVKFFRNLSNESSETSHQIDTISQGHEYSISLNMLYRKQFLGCGLFFRYGVIQQKHHLASHLWETILDVCTKSVGCLEESVQERDRLRNTVHGHTQTDVLRKYGELLICHMILTKNSKLLSVFLQLRSDLFVKVRKSEEINSVEMMLAALEVSTIVAHELFLRDFLKQMADDVEFPYPLHYDSIMAKTTEMDHLRVFKTLYGEDLRRFWRNFREESSETHLYKREENSNDNTEIAKFYQRILDMICKKCITLLESANSASEITRVKFLVENYCESFSNKNFEGPFDVDKSNGEFLSDIRSKYQERALQIVQKQFSKENIHEVTLKLFLAKDESKRTSIWEREPFSESEILQRYENQEFNPYSGLIFLKETSHEVGKENSQKLLIRKGKYDGEFFAKMQDIFMEVFEFILVERKDYQKKGLGPIEKGVYESLFNCCEVITKIVEGEIKPLEKVHGKKAYTVLCFLEDVINELHIQSKRNDEGTNELISSKMSLQSQMQSDEEEIEKKSVLVEFSRIQKMFETLFLQCHEKFIEDTCETFLDKIKRTITTSEKFEDSFRRNLWNEYFIEISNEKVKLPSQPSDYVMLSINIVNDLLDGLQLNEFQYSLVIPTVVDRLYPKFCEMYIEVVSDLEKPMEEKEVEKEGEGEDEKEVPKKEEFEKKKIPEESFLQILFDVLFVSNIFGRIDDGLESKCLSNIDEINWEVYDAQFRRNVDVSISKSYLIIGYLMYGNPDRKKYKKTIKSAKSEEKFIEMLDNFKEQFRILPIPESFKEKGNALVTSRSRPREKPAKNTKGSFFSKIIGW